MIFYGVLLFFTRLLLHGIIAFDSFLSFFLSIDGGLDGGSKTISPDGLQDISLSDPIPHLHTVLF